MIDWSKIIDEIVDAADHQISNIMPSDWAEQHRYMSTSDSSIQGLFSYDTTPYTREIINFLHPSNPYQHCAVMKGAQIGFSAGVIENGIGWIISQAPANILFLVGHDNLVEKAMNRIDGMLDSTGLRASGAIRSMANRAKNNKSGDKDRSKEFDGGVLTMGSANHKAIRQISKKYGFLDDLESMKGASKESGSTVPLVMQRFVSFGKDKKVFFISTPEQKETSNIEPEYLKGDQRKYHVPCPCCGEFIVLEWEIDSEIIPNKKAGITYKLDENFNYIDGSTGYTCQKCDGFFTDAKKMQMLRDGKWIPTAKPTDSTYLSYHISALYAPIQMDGWEDYVRKYLVANPPNQAPDEEKLKTHYNPCLGLPYEPKGTTIDAEKLKSNVRDYSMWKIPERQSIADGNGRIILVTFGSDMNGTIEDVKRNFIDDARMDWEIVAWSESGASYSVAHGSIGSFVPSHLRTDGYNHEHREIKSYEHGVENSVWLEVDKLLSKKIETDTGRFLPILSAGIDTAPYTQYSYPYIENTNYRVYGLKGDKQHDSGIFIDGDSRPVMISKEHAKLWIVNVNRYKDLLSTHTSLKWSRTGAFKQPNDFMNFPKPENGFYSDSGFFNHFDAEHKIVDEKTKRFIWKKVTANAQNHFFDCRIYNMVARDLFVMDLFKEVKVPGVKNPTWADFAKLVLNKK